MHGQRAAARCIGSEREYGSREKPWAELEDGLQGKHQELSEHHGHALQMDRWQGSLGSLPGVLAHTLFHSFHIWQQLSHRPSTGGRVSKFGSGEFPNLAPANPVTSSQKTPANTVLNSVSWVFFFGQIFLQPTTPIPTPVPSHCKFFYTRTYLKCNIFIMHCCGYDV